MTKFTETQAFGAIAYGALGLSAVAVALSGAVAGLIWPVLLVGLSCNLLCQKTIVTETHLTVTFGALLPLYRRQIALREIASAEAVTYSPLADCGGWGIRGWGRNAALNARGSRGVQVALRDGRRVLVGSQRPEELAEALAVPR